MITARHAEGGASGSGARRASAADILVVRARVQELLEARIREFCVLGLAKWAAEVPAGHPFMGWDAAEGRLVAARLA